MVCLWRKSALIVLGSDGLEVNIPEGGTDLVTLESFVSVQPYTRSVAVPEPIPLTHWPV
jgi:hypothetical protein